MMITSLAAHSLPQMWLAANRVEPAPPSAFWGGAEVRLEAACISRRIPAACQVAAHMSFSP